MNFTYGMSIPDFDHNGVIPPFLGNPTEPKNVAPYSCSITELVEKFGFSPQRRKILYGLLDFRQNLRQSGIKKGFQWLDGSFLEDIEGKKKRAPNDLDLVTIFWGYDKKFLNEVATNFPAFCDRKRCRKEYSLDHYLLDADYNPVVTVQGAAYWSQLFSHNRRGTRKGMLKIDLDTENEDIQARQKLQNT